MSDGDRSPNYRVALLCTEEINDFLAMQIIYCLAKMRVRVYLISDGKEPIYKYSRYVTRYDLAPFPDSLESPAAFRTWLADYVTQYKIDFICGSDIFPAKLVSKLSGDFSHCPVFPVAELAAVELLDDKWEFYNLLQRLKAPAPETIRINQWNRAERDRAAALPFPVMVKPPALSGGRGVVRCDSVEELDAYLNNPRPFNQTPLLIQEFCPGQDIGFGFVARDGEIIAHGVQIRDNTSIEGNCVKFVRNPEVTAIGRRIVEETRYTGAGFIDMRLSEEGAMLRVLEFNPRLWLSVAESMYYGVNYVEAGIALAANRPFRGEETVQLGEFYSVDRLRPDRLARLWARGAMSRRNLYGYWMAQSDILVVLYLFARRIRRRIARNFAGDGTRVDAREGVRLAPKEF